MQDKVLPKLCPEILLLSMMRFHTPIFSAVGTAQIVLDDLNDAQLQDDLKAIIKNLNIVSDLTKKMTQITRYEAKEYVGDTKIVDIQKASDTNQ